MEIEINFRLDEYGRTSNTKTQPASTDQHDDDDDHKTKDDHIGTAIPPRDSSNQPLNSVQPSMNTTTIPTLDYKTKVTMTNLRQDIFLSSVPLLSSVKDGRDNDINDEQQQQEEQQQQSLLLWDDLLLDCEISDCGLMPRTFWIPAQGMEPRFALEQFALDIFYHHVPAPVLKDHDMEVSGAEWWCQLRPSPEGTGRYSMHCAGKDDGDDDDDDQKDPFFQGISMHVDKDEELRILAGGTTYVHPHLSTVTYLTDLGSPTLIVDCRVQPFTGEWIVPTTSSAGDDKNDDNHYDGDGDGGGVHGFISWPSVGKHTSFDGRYLHASPTDLMEHRIMERQFQFAPRIPEGKDNDHHDVERWNKLQKRRHRRVTFLVNIWLSYRPLDVHPFPETMVDKMSGRDVANRKRLQFSSSSSSSSPLSHNDPLYTRNVTVKANMATELPDSEDHDDDDGNNKATTPTGSERYGKKSQAVVYPTETLTWALGDHKSKEKLTVNVPLQSIRQEATNGGNVMIKWERGAVCSAGGKKGTDNDDDNDEYCFRLYVDANSNDDLQEEIQSIVGDDTVESNNNNKRGIENCDNLTSTDPTITADEAKKHHRVLE
jgi:hypothetical protein